jgi:hypothetical protein
MSNNNIIQKFDKIITDLRRQMGNYTYVAPDQTEDVLPGKEDEFYKLYDRD